MRAQLGGVWRRYVYAGDRVLEETSDTGTMLARYTLESPSYYTPLLRLELSGGTNRYPLLDGVGSTRRLMDGSGNTTDFYDLEAFGVLRSQSGSTANPYKYGGGWGYMTDPSGVLQLGARFYP